MNRWLIAAGTAVPVMAATLLTAPGPARGAVPDAAVTSTQESVATPGTSFNWAGYAATGAAGTFTSVSASWTQPSVSCGATNAPVTIWVGLDGGGPQSPGTGNAATVGTEATCTNGVASYRGIVDMIPNAPEYSTGTVKPGDVMDAIAAYEGNGFFALFISDDTQGWVSETTQPAFTTPYAGPSSAEVIVARKTDIFGDGFLANFGSVPFTGVTVNNYPIGDSTNLSQSTMYDTPQNSTVCMNDLCSTGKYVLATPSALTGGNAFSVTFNNAAGPNDPGPLR